MTLPLPLPLRASFAQFVGREYGLSFEGARYAALELNVLNATKALGVTPLALLNAVRAGDVHMRANLIGALTIGETYFLREPTHFAWLKRYLERSTGPRRIWSAGCASGEECYSMAITAIEALGSAANRVEIIATDLDPAALDRARLGEYRPWSFRSTDAGFRQRWFERRGDRLRVRESVRSLVHFRELNLADGSSKGPDGTDVVFCRNVLPYFDTKAQRNAASVLRSALGAQGFVITASADPPLLDPRLLKTEYDGVRCYVLSSGITAPIRPHQPRATLKPIAAVEARPTPRRSVSSTAAETRILEASDSGVQSENTTSSDGSVTSADPLQYLQRAQRALERGDFHNVVRDARRALMVEPRSVYSHLLIAISALRSRQISLAVRSARVGKKVLASFTGDTLPGFADGLSRQDLYVLFTSVEQLSDSILPENPWTAKQKKS